MRKNLFDLIKKSEVNYSQEAMRIEALFANQKFTLTYYEISLEDYINSEIFYKWKDRGTFLNTLDLRNELKLNQKDLEKADLNKLLIYFEVLINLICLLPTNIPKVIDRLSSIIIENILSILNKLNYEFYRNPNQQCIIVEKSKFTTAVSELYEDISEKVIEYRRFNLKGKIEEKRAILQVLALKFDGIEENFKGTNYSKLAENTAFLLNNLHIRHDNEGNNPKNNEINMNNEEFEQWYDKTYDTVLMALMINHYLDYKNDIQNLRKSLKK